jgi:hypothetical protein
MRQARFCRSMGSPFLADFLEYAADGYDEDERLQALLDHHVRNRRIALRLAAAAHYRVLQDAVPEAAAHFPSTGGDANAAEAWWAILNDIRRHASEYRSLIARPVQTNEVARALPICAAMHVVARETRLPLRVYEIGASAGLLLNFDHYGYEIPERFGPPPEVIERRGCDLHPFDVNKVSDTQRLLSYVWPDQIERLERLRSAIEIAREYPVHVDHDDAVIWARERIATREETAAVLMHAVMMEHVAANDRESLLETIEELGDASRTAAPFAWLRMEAGGQGRYETNVTLWPGKRTIAVAISDGHAQNLQWR